MEDFALSGRDGKARCLYETRAKMKSARNDESGKDGVTTLELSTLRYIN